MVSACPLFTRGLTDALNMLTLGLGEAVASVVVALPNIESDEVLADGLLVGMASASLFESFFMSNEKSLARGGVQFASSLPAADNGFEVVSALENGAAGTFDRNAKGDAAPAVADAAAFPNPLLRLDRRTLY